MNLRIEDYSAANDRELPSAPGPRRSSQGRTEPFLRGPVPLHWLAKAASQRKPALAAGLCLWFQRGVSRQAGPVRVGAGVRKKLGLSAGQMLRGLRALEDAGLVVFAKQGRGRSAVVDIVCPPADGRGDTTDTRQ